MASNDNSRGKLLTAGGILSIVAGVFQISSVVSIAVNFLVPGWSSYEVAELLLLPLLPGAWRSEILWLVIPRYWSWTVHNWWVIIGGCAGVLGILALIGGISAIRRKRFGLSLAGAICALASGLLGVLAVIFVALGKKEFGAKG
jgi:hypothetical protein